nr:MAG TPA: hypothetical protein [Caudoviricetes sp.]
MKYIELQYRENRQDRGNRDINFKASSKPYNVPKIISLYFI